MGILYDILTKKICPRCGCIMSPDSELNVCECCLDELFENDNEEVINER